MDENKLDESSHMHQVKEALAVTGSHNAEDHFQLCCLDLDLTDTLALLTLLPILPESRKPISI